MRITCPNCRAQYDVDSSMIPEAGRDVQCSSCAHTWLVSHTGENVAEEKPQAEQRLPEEVEAEAVSDAGEEAETWDEVTPAPDEESTAHAEAVAKTTAVEEATSDEESEATTGEGEPDDGAPEDSDPDPDDRFRAAIERSREDASEPDRDEGEAFRASIRDAVAKPDAAHSETDPVDADGDEDTPALDDEVADILREEAEFEATRRRSEVPPPAFEPQGDLGLDEDRPSDVLRERLDRMRGDGVPEPTIASTVASGDIEGSTLTGPRRERLPDIEEINSSLRPSTGEEEVELPMSMSELTEARRSGFRTGFAAVVLLVAVLVGGYIYAPQIIRAIPATEPAMISYVEIANSARDRIDGMMAKAISGLNGLTGSGSNGA